MPGHCGIKAGHSCYLSLERSIAFVQTNQRTAQCRHLLHVFDVSTFSGRYELEILAASAADQGRWTARGTNQFGTCESDCQLTIVSKPTTKDEKGKPSEEPEKPKKPEKKLKKKVESPPSEKSGEPPQFHHTLSDVSVKERDSLVLSVTCTTLPEPEVEWFRNDERVRHGENSYLLRKDKG